MYRAKKAIFCWQALWNQGTAGASSKNPIYAWLGRSLLMFWRQGKLDVVLAVVAAPAATRPAQAVHRCRVMDHRSNREAELCSMISQSV